MPVLEGKKLGHFLLQNGHLQTFLPAFKTYATPDYKRERISTPDDDFLDLDWLYASPKKSDLIEKSIIILSHGLQGSAYSKYIMDTAIQLSAHGYDVCAWNCRNCSEEVNRAQKMYHHGDIEDIGYVVQHAHRLQYKNIFLVGFSMGGSINTKFMSIHEQRHLATAGIAFSTPCDLAGAASTLDRKVNRPLKKYFLKALKEKISLKLKQYPEALPQNVWEQIITWNDFDRLVSAPYNGYDDLDAFYAQGSCKNFLDKLNRPILLVNALNDPILTGSCFPYQIAENNDSLYFLPMKTGGHVYFPMNLRLSSAATGLIVKFIESLNKTKPFAL